MSDLEFEIQRCGSLATAESDLSDDNQRDIVVDGVALHGLKDVLKNVLSRLPLAGFEQGDEAIVVQEFVVPLGLSDAVGVSNRTSPLSKVNCETGSCSSMLCISPTQVPVLECARRCECWRDG